MKEKSANTTGKKKLIYYLILAISVALLVTATVLTVYFVAGGDDIVLDNPPEQQNPVTPPDDSNKPQEPDKPTTGDDPVKFVNPIAFETASVSHNEIFFNQTADMYYKHQGIDIAAEAGTEVVAMADGTVEQIYLGKTLGNEIVINHGDGLKTVYRFVDAIDGLKAGDTVKQGQKFASVSSAESGSERKDGAHLHLEITLNGKAADPVEYLNYGK